MTFSEKNILDAIASVLAENKTFLKLNNGQGNAAPAPMDMGNPMGGADPMMGGMGGADPMAGGADPMAGGMDASADPMAGGVGPMNGGDNQFDSNFDAGVEADEDSDPKKYIQQLTGKLSQKLNSYNEEQQDAELAKYVGQMIIKAVAKCLDEDDKKDLIKTINTTEQEAGDDSNDSEGSDGMDDGSGMSMDDGSGMGGDMPDPNMQQPMMEMKFTKRDIKRLFENFNDVTMDTEKQEDERPRKDKKTIETGPFAAKKFLKR